jgi:hypothetical protein
LDLDILFIVLGLIELLLLVCRLLVFSLLLFDLMDRWLLLLHLLYLLQGSLAVAFFVCLGVLHLVVVNDLVIGLFLLLLVLGDLELSVSIVVPLLLIISFDLSSALLLLFNLWIGSFVNGVLAVG